MVKNCILAKRVAEVTRPYGVLAQLGEHLPYKQRVIGSSPIGPIWEAGNGFPVNFLIYIIYGEIAQLARAYGSYP